MISICVITELSIKKNKSVLSYSAKWVIDKIKTAIINKLRGWRKENISRLPFLKQAIETFLKD